MSEGQESGPLVGSLNAQNAVVAGHIGTVNLNDAQGLEPLSNILDGAERAGRPDPTRPFRDRAAWTDVKAGCTFRRTLTDETLGWLLETQGGYRDLLVLAGSGMGKTTFLMQLAVAAHGEGFACYWCGDVGLRPA
ncbi:MAG: hypothetical protein EOO70_10320, partial [Myxococcaceae bacterium]